MSTFIGSGLRVNQSSVNNNNQLIGRQAGQSLTSGSNNIIIGCRAGRCTTTGNNNVYIGRCAGHCATSASNNNFLGFRSGRNTTTGQPNNLYGRNAGCNNINGSNNIAIGYNAGTTGLSPNGLLNLNCAFNQVIMGNSNHTCAQIGVSWTTVSDTRNKCIYGAVEKGLGFLQGITPIEYQRKDRETNEIIDPLNKRRYGFSAQEILALEGDNPVIVSADDPDLLQIASDHLLPVMVNAIKELAADVEYLENRVAKRANSS